MPYPSKYQAPRIWVSSCFPRLVTSAVTRTEDRGGSFFRHTVARASLPKPRRPQLRTFSPFQPHPHPGSRRSRAPSPPGLDSGERTSGARTAVKWQLRPAHAGAAAGYGWPQLQAPPPAGPPPSTPSRLGSANPRLPGAA
ncbi:PREDICTED: splicing factor, proline- and glutamine-rich-like [Colobus angolensis palliatus]|uniref:splicing factor, proline- and glutamine-rich-like n=1 Tax=Colobus angolensis palliatus TaxID=336983 RepID=UPI0005F423A5|nr:PREDICTED: splicing factor, proline- and glutamine-rich-like [Colobus angolensis palliatus]